MSGFALIFNRDGSPVEPQTLDRMMDRIAHRGPDGSETWLDGSLAMGHHHFWTTPEEVGERQPLTNDKGDVRILFDGRLDNRSELLAALHLGTREGARLSDAALLLRAYHQWGKHCFEHLLGPFAIVIYDADHRRILCARDPLGDRALSYYLDARVLIIASEPYAVLSHPVVDQRFDDRTLVYCFIADSPPDGRTFFRSVQELLPSHAMTVDAHVGNKWRYWQVDATARLRYKSDDEYAEHFLHLLRESVRCRMRSVSPPGVLMSGGLDSTSVAALAAQELTERSTSGPLRTLSFVFDELHGADERAYIEPFTERFGTEALYVRSDDYWPLCNPEMLPWNPNAPDLNPSRVAIEQGYRVASDEGIRVMLTGDMADQLYLGWGEWLADLLREWRLDDALKNILWHIREEGLRSPKLRSAVSIMRSQLLASLPSLNSSNSKEPAVSYDWLTQRANSILKERASRNQEKDTETSVRRKAQVQAVLGMESAFAISMYPFFSNPWSLDFRHPYRDRRLAEFMMAIPAHQLYQRGYHKPLTRTAMKGILPEKVRMRQEVTTWLHLFARGMVERGQTTANLYLTRSNALWRNYVKSEWISSVYPTQIINQQDGRELVVLWNCIATELWRERFDNSTQNHHYGTQRHGE